MEAAVSSGSIPILAIYTSKKNRPVSTILQFKSPPSLCRNCTGMVEQNLTRRMCCQSKSFLGKEPMHSQHLNTLWQKKIQPRNPTRNIKYLTYPWIFATTPFQMVLCFLLAPVEIPEASPSNHPIWPSAGGKAKSRATTPQRPRPIDRQPPLKGRTCEGGEAEEVFFGGDFLWVRFFLGGEVFLKKLSNEKNPVGWVRGWNTIATYKSGIIFLNPWNEDPD